MDKNNRPAWMSDPLVKDIPVRKLDFLGQMFAESQGKSQKELLASVIPMIARAKRENLSFTPQEMTAAISAIRNHSSAEELKQIDNILKKAQNGGN